MGVKATTKITVDTDKLRKEKPGKIQDRSIIVMTDESGYKDFSYKDPTDKNYKDNLIQKVDKGVDREWTIEALNGKDTVTFNDFDCPDELKLYQKKPIKDGKSKMKTKINKSFTSEVNVWYTFKIEFEGNEYFWDPQDENRPPF